MKKIVSILAFCSLFLMAFSQGNRSVDIVHTKGGFILKGEIIQWSQDGMLIIRSMNGTEIPVPLEQIRKVRQKIFTSKEGYRSRPYAFQEKGLYNVTAFGMSWGPQTGINASHAVGYRFNRWFSAGIGAGYSNFEAGEAKRIIPVFADFRGFLLEKNISPYYALRGGYGFALVHQDASLTDAKGGIMINPEIGYRFGAGEHINLLFGVGLHFQHAEFTWEWPWGDEVFVDEMKYRRVEFKLGMLF